MLSVAIVIFREILEIALILGVVLAATQGLPGRGRWVVLGFLGGAAGASLVAVFAEAIANAAEGIGQELFNAGILLTAALVIGWTVLWMKKHAREMTAHLKKIGRDVVEGNAPRYSLALVIMLAILREGSEIVLFTYGMLAAGQPVATIVSGSVVGLVTGGGIGALLYFGLVTLPTRYIFQVTTWLLVLLTAGMASVAAKFLASAGYFASLSSPVWDTSALLSEEGVVGKVFHALLGYTARPLGIQVVFYLAVLFLLVGLMQWVGRTPQNLNAKPAVQ